MTYSQVGRFAALAEQKNYTPSDADTVNGQRPKPGNMLSDAGRVQRANRLRRFVAAVEDRARHDGELTSEEHKRIEWTRAKADRFDPLVRRSDPIPDPPPPRSRLRTVT
jgi:hypothetical protein